MSEATAQPGARMTAEIAEQPHVFGELLAHRAEIAEVATRIAERRPRFALLAARGSSDHAALYAKYLIEVLLQLPVGLVSPSTTTLYGARPDLTDVLLLSVSQSGGSPDLLEVTEAGRKAGATTVAVTNTAESPLNRAAEMSVGIRAGQEQAVAATKTYSATLLALYLLVDAVRGGNAEHARALPELARTTLDTTEQAVAEAVHRYRFADRMVTTGRGYSLATACEAALKLAETSYLSARAYSGADLLHGPVAAVDAETAVLALCSAGKGGASTREVLEAVHERGADICAIGSAAADVPAAHRIGVPDCAEELAPVLEVLPVQRLALGLALERGGDPDNPRGLKKVTRTR
ncbi:glutamine--fructose-6-phosphate transaminase [Saccharopolyspora erythraea NRRL 2338]|uniref:Glucosamine-fructose-6-phosphate aminotransferase n=2 Tax=Saccharopolyspora erythraea TaxID=1836 RepID=A4F722_SACEN|nr:SIS domain-containing protein [Saccharopolyspora erythraea]EQD82087.1 glucosamine-6-phosphate deaminase [Saccharopolyspora erythraea D]PFG93647.1 glutamine--fructose-6-phosphate transaminase [Saccharopolyspora erythraea NRRL 2338]QRK90499.1 SIS domain-containing protein [Saccharopolyspora erythraea]CAL99846.1 glucosamine-fructose-6-phosphate aminotransferase [Saccharopolyspora erythraea NRRL 2338]